MKKRYKFAIICSLFGLVAVTFSSTLLGLAVYQTPAGNIYLEFHPSFWSVIGISVFSVLAYSLILGIIHETKTLNLGQPQAEDFLKNFSEKKLRVISSHSLPEQIKTINRNVTIFLFEDSSED